MNEIQLTKANLSEIFKRAENLYDLEIEGKSIEKILEEYLNIIYEERLYELEGEQKETLINEIASILNIANYEYRTGQSIMSDITFDGHQTLAELEELEAEGKDNPEQSYLDVLFRLQDQTAEKREERYHKYLLSPLTEEDIIQSEENEETNNKPKERAIGGNKMAKATDLSVMKKLTEERLEKSENGKLIVSEKLDGSSLYLTYDHEGKLQRAEQRGTDDTDTSIPLERVLKIEGVKEHIDISLFELKSDETVELRGEVLVERDKYKKINEELEANGEEVFTNGRNAGAGILKDKDERFTNQMTFMGFEAYKIGDRTLPEIPTERIKQNLKEEFFKTNNIKQPRIYMIESWEDFYEIYQKYEIEDILEESNYDMDGLIVSIDTDKIVINNSKEVEHSFGAKFSPTTELLKVRDVEYTVGKDGRISLVIRFTPTDVGGVIVEYSKLDSINSTTPETFLNLFQVGDEVLVGRMGGVIPKVMYNQKFRPLIKTVVDNLSEFFEKIKDEENKDSIEKIEEILHFVKQTKVTSENKAYLLKYATKISESYVINSKKLKDTKLYNRVLLDTIKELIKEKEIKANKFKVDAKTIKDEFSTMDLEHTTEENLTDGIQFSSTCPICGEKLSGLEEGDKLIKCINPGCEGIHKAVINGFVESLSTRLDGKPKLTISELYEFLKEKYNLTNMTYDEFLDIAVPRAALEKKYNILKNPKMSLKEYISSNPLRRDISRVLLRELEKQSIIKKEDKYEVLNKVYEDKVISIKTIDFLYDNGIIKNSLDLMNLTEEDFKDENGNYYEGFKENKANNILHQLNVIRKNNFDYNFISALNIPNFGSSNSKLVFNVISLDKILTLNLDNQEAYNFLHETLMNITGIAEITASSFVDFIKENKDEIMQLKEKFELIKTEILDTSNALPLKIVPTNSLNAGSLQDGKSWEDRKTFKTALNKQLITIEGQSYLVNVTSKVGTKIDPSKIEMIISDTPEAPKGVAYQKAGGLYLTTAQFIAFTQGELDLNTLRNQTSTEDKNNTRQP